MTAKKRVLVVDDDSTLTGLVKLRLEKTGAYEVRTENRGAAAAAAAREYRPDLILLDVVMPECDGGDVLEQLQADRALARIPVVFLTGTMTEEALDARRGRIEGYPVISKQSDPKTLVQAIEAALAPAR
jgi:two-component system, OmpR family, response regulator